MPNHPIVSQAAPAPGLDASFYRGLRLALALSALSWSALGALVYGVVALAS
jgi:hypothetical protein